MVYYNPYLKGNKLVTVALRLRPGHFSPTLFKKVVSIFNYYVSPKSYLQNCLLSRLAVYLIKAVVDP